MREQRFAIRARLALEEWFVPIVILLLLVATLAGWAAITSGSEEPTVETWSTTGSFDHGAVVENETHPFEADAQLDDRSLYYTAVTPTLDGEFAFEYTAESSDLDLEIEADAVIRSVTDEEEHWMTNTSLERTEATDLEPGETETADFSVDVDEQQAEIEAIEDTLGQTPDEVELLVLTTVSLSGTVDGEPVDSVEQYELLIEDEGDAYSVSVNSDEHRTHQLSTTEETTTAGVDLDSIGPLTVLVGSLAALGVLTVAKRADRLTPNTNTVGAFEAARERERFGEWITAGTLPDGIETYPSITVDSLEGIVDVAIDANRRVIQDDDMYTVIDDGVVYVYDQTTSEIRGVAPRESDCVAASNLECPETVDYVAGSSTDD